MKEKDEVYTDRFVPYQNIDFSDESVSYFKLDTRDFTVFVVKDRPDKVDTINPTPDIRERPSEYFFTAAELKTLIDRYYKESGGKKEWRYFSLQGRAHLLTADWQMKWITIIVIPNRGLLIVDFNKDYIYSKTILSEPVNTKEL